MSGKPPSPTSTPPGGPPSRPDLQNIQAFVRKFIPFNARPITNGLKSGPGQYIIATFAAAHTDTVFTHALGHIPAQYIVCEAPLPGAPFTVPTVPVSVLQGGTGVTTLAASPFVVLSPSVQQTGSINVSSSGTFGGTITVGTAGVSTASAFQFGNSVGGSTFTNLNSSGGVVAGITGTALNIGIPGVRNLLAIDGSGNAGFFANVQSGGSILAGSSGTGVVNAGTMQVGGSGNTGNLLLNVATSSANGVLVNYNNSATGVFAMFGGGTSPVATISNTGAIQATSGSATQAYVLPVYSASGASLASTTHGVADTITASGISTTVTLGGAAVFASTPTWFVYDTTGLTLPTITAESSSAITFTSIIGHVYRFSALGA